MELTSEIDARFLRMQGKRETVRKLKLELDQEQAELVQLLNAAGIKTRIIGDERFEVETRAFFNKTTLEQARKLNATSEQPDLKALRHLYDKGIDVPGATVSEWISRPYKVR